MACLLSMMKMNRTAPLSSLVSIAISAPGGKISRRSERSIKDELNSGDLTKTLNTPSWLNPHQQTIRRHSIPLLTGRRGSASSPCETKRVNQFDPGLRSASDQHYSGNSDIDSASLMARFSSPGFARGCVHALAIILQAVAAIQ